MCFVCDQLRSGKGYDAIGGYRPTLMTSGSDAGGGQSRPAGRVMPQGSGTDGRRVLIRGASILSMDPAVGDFAEGDILIEGKTIRAVGAHIDAGDAAVI